MKKIFVEEDMNILVEALEAHDIKVQEEIIEAEESNAANSVVFGLSKDMVATKLMKQFFENVSEHDDCMFAEGCNEDVATMMATFTEKK